MGIEQIQKEVIEETTTAQKKANTEILIKLIHQNQDGATEALAKSFQNQEHIYSIRNDENPELWIYKEGIYLPNGASYLQEHCRAECGEAYTPNIFNKVLAKITADNFISPEEFFGKDASINDKIAVQNGILDLHTKTLTPHNPETIFFNKIPTTYQPGQDCPKIKKFCISIFKNGEQEINLISELFGWMLKGRYYPHKIIVIDGDGRNGKGTFFNLIKAFLGSKNCAGIRFESFDTDDFAASELFGKRVNLFSDSGSTDFKNTSLLKSLSGEDIMTANRKFKNRLTFTNTAKLMFAFNELPRVSDMSFGYWNRQLYLSCPYRFQSTEEMIKLNSEESQNVKLSNPDILAEITSCEELQGLLNWALEGYDRLEANGGFSYSLTTEEVQQIITRKSNSFAAFYKDCVVEDEEREISKIELRKAYQAYCKVWKVKPCSDNYVKKFLGEQGIGYRQVRTAQVSARVWEGINLHQKTPNTHSPHILNRFFEVLGVFENTSDLEKGVNPVIPVSLGVPVWDKDKLVWLSCTFENCQGTPCNFDSIHGGKPRCLLHYGQAEESVA